MMKSKHFLSVAVMALAALFFQACSSDKSADAREILSTVPSDVSLVAVFNTGAILEKAGCKVDGEKITPGKEMQNALARVSNPRTKKILNTLLNGKSGLNPSVCVLFQDGYNFYLTGLASDPGKLKKMMSENGMPAFESEKGVDISENMAIADNRFWINLQSGSIQAQDIRHFNTLSESQSFLSNAYAETLCTVTKDVEGWGNIFGIINTCNLDMQNKMVAQVAIQALFEDPEAMTFSVNFTKGAMDAQATVINSKGKTAKYLLPSDKLDVNTIASLGGTAEAVVAFSIPSKLISNLQKDTKSKITSMISMYLQQFGCVNGTVACAVSGDNLNGVITTDGNNTTALSSLLSSGDMSVTMNGNQMKFTKGTVSGPANVAQVSSQFNGAIGGVVFGNVFSADSQNPFDSGSLLLFADKGGLIFKVHASAKNKNVNPILSLITNSKF